MLKLMFCHQDQNYKLVSSKVLYLSYLAAIFAAILDFKKRRSIHLLVLGNRQYILVKGNFARSEAGPLDYHTSDQRSRSRRYPTPNLRNDYIEARRIFYKRVKNMDYIFFFDCLRIDPPWFAPNWSGLVPFWCSAPYSAAAKKKRIARINHSCHQGWGRS